MKKYRFAFSKSMFAIFALILLAAAAAIVFASLRLAGVGPFESVYPATDIVSIVAYLAFLILITLDLVLSYYAFKEDTFLSVQLFSRKCIARDLIAKLVIDEASGLAVLYYLNSESPDALLFVTIRIYPKRLDAFVADLRRFKPDVVVEYNPAAPDAPSDEEGDK